MSSNAPRCLACLVLASTWVGCSRPEPPSAEALATYAAKYSRTGTSGALRPSNGEEQGAAVPTAATGLRVTIVSARDLEDYDSGLGETDAYVRLEYDGRRWETSVVDDTTAPVWGDSFVFAQRRGEAMTLTVWDSDAISDEKMAVVALVVESLRPGEVKEISIALREGQAGSLLVRLEGIELKP